MWLVLYTLSYVYSVQQYILWGFKLKLLGISEKFESIKCYPLPNFTFNKFLCLILIYCLYILLDQRTALHFKSNKALPNQSYFDADFWPPCARSTNLLWKRGKGKWFPRKRAAMKVCLGNLGKHGSTHWIQVWFDTTAGRTERRERHCVSLTKIIYQLPDLIK